LVSGELRICCVPARKYGAGSVTSVASRCTVAPIEVVT
jgi:hypothetical protein